MRGWSDMGEIKRYTIQTMRIRGQEPFITMGINGGGRYVKYTDHKASLEQLQKENEQLKADRNWISVDDRLPEIYLGVLVWSIDEIFIADRYPDCYRCNGEPIDNVTHWQPLPKPPKESK